MRPCIRWKRDALQARSRLPADRSIAGHSSSGFWTAISRLRERAQQRWRWLRLLLSLGVLGWVLLQANFIELSSTFGSTSLLLLATAMLTYAFGLLICGLRWHILLCIQEVSISLKDAFCLYWIGSFFNMFLLSSVGGDFFRIHLLGRRLGQHVRVLSSVLADRVTGVLALGALGGAAAFWIAAFRWNWDRTYSIGPALLLSLLPLSLLWVVTQGDKLWTWGKDHLPPRLYGPLADALGSLSLYTHSPSRLMAVMMLSLLLQINVVIEYFLIAQAVGLQISPVYFFALVPAIAAASMLPISINGIGVREGMLVSALVPLGASAEAALAIGVWVHLLRVLASLGGGLIYWWK